MDEIDNFLCQKYPPMWYLHDIVVRMYATCMHDCIMGRGDSTVVAMCACGEFVHLTAEQNLTNCTKS